MNVIFQVVFRYRISNKFSQIINFYIEIHTTHHFIRDNKIQNTNRGSL